MKHKKEKEKLEENSNVKRINATESEKLLSAVETVHQQSFCGIHVSVLVFSCVNKGSSTMVASPRDSIASQSNKLPLSKALFR